jgi:hypothetical protein
LGEPERLLCIKTACIFIQYAFHCKQNIDKLLSPHGMAARVKTLKALNIPCFQVIISGFPLPTPVLTPGWAIF